MAMQYLEQTMTQNGFNGEDSSCLEKWKSTPAAVTSFDDNIGGRFDCNICLDSVQDPVVTLCGHLYCWPCIYKWLQYDTNSAENGGLQQQQCPVCKAEVSQTTLVPLYGRDQTTTKTSKGKAPHLGIVIPRRPLAPSCMMDALVSPTFATSPRPTLQQSQPDYVHPNMFEPPVIGMFGEMVYARIFGNSITNLYTYPNSYHYVGINSPRVRRHVMQADKSLSQICLFLFCFICLCLVLF